MAAMTPGGRATQDAEPAEDAAPSERLDAIVAPAAKALLDHLVGAGHAAYVVGGSLRDALLGRPPADWDLATDARPERLVTLFPGSVYENRFGTVAVRRDDDVFEITTFRTEHEYADFRRPHRVEFGDDLVADLARRDFTVNAMAWGRAPGDDGNALVDPFGGRADLGTRTLRAVGDPDARFREDALRMVRAVRLAAALEFDIEPATIAAIAANARARRPPVRGAHRRRAREAARRAAPVGGTAHRRGHGPARGDLAGPRRPAGHPAEQGSRRGPVGPHDAHGRRRAAGAPRGPPGGAVHDIGKPSTLADGHFPHHEMAGAVIADHLLRRLRYPRAAAEEVVLLVRHHMFTVDPGLTDAAIRRFIMRVGREHLDALFALRRADDLGSGMPPDDPDTLAFRARIDAELHAQVPLDRSALAVDGTDLMRELDLEPGPRLGRVIDVLLDRVIADPGLNERGSLLLLAQGILADMYADRVDCDRGAAPGGARPDDGHGRPGGAPVPAGRRRRPAQLDRRGGAGARRARAGRRRGALQLAWRAQAIDPENAAAQRLAARLEEVLTTRGEPLPPREESHP